MKLFLKKVGREVGAHLTQSVDVGTSWNPSLTVSDATFTISLY